MSVLFISGHLKESKAIEVKLYIIYLYIYIKLYIINMIIIREKFFSHDYF